MVCSNWSDFKAFVDGRCAKLSYFSDGRAYSLTAYDGPEVASISLVLDEQNPDTADFLANYAPGANQRIKPCSVDGVPQVNSIPAVDSKLACFCPSVAGDPTPAVPYVDYQVSDSYAQLFGMELEVIGAAKGDELRFQVGYDGPSEFVVVSDYGGKKFISDSFKMTFSSPRVSNPIPQGLKLRVIWVFKDSESPSTPSVSVMYHLQRPYAQ